MAYESTGVTDPAAQRTEAIAVFSCVLEGAAGSRAELPRALGLCDEGWQAEAGN